mmetsp:Transcript_24642/g.58192  ORF Transcript_24642/g.58192 Transcript_24642/m.58192 type:complete len:265 (+) Transcript_24642:371-1165(+)
MAKGICARARRRSSGGGYEAQKGGSKNLVDAAARQAREDAGESKYAPAGMRPEWCDDHYEQRALKLAEEAAAGEVAANALVADAERVEWEDRQRAGWRERTHRYEVKRRELRASAQQASARTELVALIAVVDGRAPDPVVSKTVARMAQRDALKLAAVLLDMSENVGAERTGAAMKKATARTGGALCGQWRYPTSPVAKNELFKRWRRLVFVASFALFKTLARPARLNAATSSGACHPPAPAARGVNLKLMSPVVSARIATTLS